jgi:hypothetical protein
LKSSNAKARLNFQSVLKAKWNRRIGLTSGRIRCVVGREKEKLLCSIPWKKKILKAVFDSVDGFSDSSHFWKTLKLMKKTKSGL